MKPGELVWLVKGSPLYEVMATTDGGTTRHYTGCIPELTMGIEVERVDTRGFEEQGVRWSHVIVGDQLVWTRTSLLKPVREAGVGCEEG